MPTLMPMLDFSSYRDEFSRIARRRLEEIQDRDRDRRKERAAAEREDDFGVDALVALATPDELAAFNEKLDRYDAQLLAALLEIEERLTELRQQKEALLEQAHVLPDGRRVFKSEDGRHVFDEFGNNLDDEVDPGLIADDGPHSERYLNILSGTAELDERAADIRAGLDRVDEAKAYAASGEATTAGLAEVEADLDAMMADLMHEPKPALAPTIESPQIQADQLLSPHR